ncbi:prolipoprotein diacylglyceryl transferase [Mycoplasmopsis agassizii]|uniref:Phosphatidylglycerol--prolipoprotein diacylglyceryl transferase n=1 Tax=Mycoplasmopsis agassizii TaxID=33922 RepID=A0A269TK74_9BACT|nr:prolipoprotein diacylglyceryl transferase [Mycoplasmopsis agassizii]PAK21781.1 prolipoprotein diacylglyceryl transferase [Mycoplasmopsis agassizii]
MNQISGIDFSTWYPFREGTATYLFSIGSWDFPIYTFTMLVGILTAIVTIAFFWYRQRYAMEELAVLVLITIPMSIIGARLWYIFERLIYNSANPFPNSAWYAVWEGGLSIQGGVILPTIANLIYIFFKRNKIDYRLAISFILPAVLIGQAIGRFGNFANHEVYGRIDYDGSHTLIWGETFARQMYIYNATDPISSAALRIPLFLYEAIFSLAGYVVLVWIFNFFGLFRPGTVGGMYLFYYGVVRFIMEPLREESYDYYTIIAYIFVFFGALMVWYFEIFSTHRYVRVRLKYRFDYALVYRSSLSWMGPLLPKTKIPLITLENTLEGAKGSEVATTTDEPQISRDRLRKRRPER